MKLPVAIACCLAAIRIPALAAERAEPAGWRPAEVPHSEKNSRMPGPGIAWYRCWVKIPAAWGNKEVTLAVAGLGHAHEAFANGAKIGGAGRFPPHFQNGIEAANRYVLPAEKVRAGEWNHVAIRLYDHDGRGGFTGEAPQLGTDEQHISLQGQWQFRAGDDPSWSGPSSAAEVETAFQFATVEQDAAPLGARGHKMSPRGDPLSPAEAAKSFVVPRDLEIKQVLAEPVVRQPVFLNFDERGRMWVVQYIQYPAPAGLNVVSKDVFWRAVYDKIPEAPPRGVRGLDKITIHEDSDGDGTFDQHTTFVDGLNIATACVKGRGGVWVLNPPYLLFYPDRDDNDVPDGDPIVHLEGFGLEDTHSVINSLRWGPDGWLYAAQGSTVTANVRVRAGNRGTRETAPAVVYSQGQNIWRYHPETHRYEVFAEGGGNAFGVEIDDKGRIFSGHNGGDTRGFHYMQGAYLRKGFEKHGELSNPYAFGYFPHMSGTPGERFSHNFIIYHGGALPQRYAGKLFGVEPLQGRVVLSTISPTGSTFHTRDLERVVTSADSWFRPVDIKVGPDGAIYLCDWYDRQVTHTRNQEGNIDASNGRIYRLTGRDIAPFKPFHLGRRTSQELAEISMGHENLWFRQEALRLLYDRRDGSVAPVLASCLRTNRGQSALQALWALNACGGLTTNMAVECLGHPEPQVRLWTARLLGDDRDGSPAIVGQLARSALTEDEVEVRAQLACTAKRLPAANTLAVIANLLRHDEDVREPRLPLLCWWAIESKCQSDRDTVLRLFEDSPFWTLPMVEEHLLDRIARRFAAAGTRKDLLACARLFELSPSRQHSQKLMRGFEEAFKGRALRGLPDELVAAMARHDTISPVLRVRRGDPEAIVEALGVVRDTRAESRQRRRFIEVLGEIKYAGAIEALLEVITQPDSPDVLLKPALTALLSYDEPRIGDVVAERFSSFSRETQLAALTLLASRPKWGLALAQAVHAGRIDKSEVPRDVVRQLWRHRESHLAELMSKLWPPPGNPTTAEMSAQLKRFTDVVRGGTGDPYNGKKLFTAACSACHKLYQQGGQIGPDLTTYQRTDLDALLLHIVNPSAEIREGYEGFVIETTDDRTLTGFLVERDRATVVLRGLDGQNVTLQQQEILEMKAAGLSLMPEGLLDGLPDQQVRDLFAYLRSTQPLAN
jgi:putative heme-binding domain-containing protein